MTLRNLFTVSALTSALLLAGCGGDIVIETAQSGNNTGNTGGTGTGGTGTTPPAAVCPAFASQGAAIGGNDKPVCEVTGTLTADATFSANILWALKGKVAVGNDKANSATLTVEPGTTIFGKTGADFLVVSRGSKINAVGSKDKPIVFTSLTDLVGGSNDASAGQWGGMVLLGQAPSNACNQAELASCSIESEGDAGPYGGDKMDDNSGILKYVVVKYAGYEVLPDNELNGITFAGVGSATTVDYVQVHNNLDDGIELFGGAVDLRHIVLTGNRDDSLDWTDGWSGRVQFAYIEHSRTGEKANRGIEADNNAKTFNAVPLSHPVISNMTIVGNTYDSAEDDSEGILLRRGTEAEFYNTLITGPVGMGECFELNDDETVAAAEAGKIVFKNSIIDCAEPFKDSVDANKNVTFNAQQWFESSNNNNFVGDAQIGRYIPAQTSPALGKGMDVQNSVNPWFASVDFIGAFNAENDWTEGWTVGLHVSEAGLSSCPTGTSQVATLTGKLNCMVDGANGNITQNITLKAGADYVLNGKVTIGGDKVNPATLTIEPGVRVFGRSGADFLVISRGSKIMAEGTEQKPIVFTSVQDVIGGNTASGQWGGIVLLGQAPTNNCNQADLANCSIEAEGDAGPYGGANWADNSGVLKYVVVKHAGYEVLPDNELNGVTFAGVGSGTSVDFLQVHDNLDDGVEVFGGAVNLKHIVLTQNRDDSLDWSDGWTGKAQYVLVRHAQDDSKANRGIEADNNAKVFGALPLTMPTIANMTIIGNNYDSAEDDSEGVLLRRGTAAKLYNFVITGPDLMGECLETNEQETADLALNGTTVMESSTLACKENFKGKLNDTTTIEAWFLGQTGNSVASPADVVDGIYTIDAKAAKDLSADSFFDKPSHIGAVSKAADWTKNWTVGLQ